MKKTASSIIFFAIILSLIGCKEVQDDTRLLVSGRLINQFNEPIDKVEVNMLNSSSFFQVGQSITDEDGFFRAVTLSPTSAVAVRFNLPESVSIPENRSFLRNRTITVASELYDTSKEIPLPSVQVSNLADVTIIIFDTSTNLERFFYRFSANVFSDEGFMINEAFQLETTIRDWQTISRTGSLNISNGIAQINLLSIQGQSINFEYLNLETDEWESIILEINQSSHEFEIFY